MTMCCCYFSLVIVVVVVVVLLLLLTFLFLFLLLFVVVHLLLRDIVVLCSRSLSYYLFLIIFLFPLRPRQHVRVLVRVVASWRSWKEQSLESRNKRRGKTRNFMASCCHSRWEWQRYRDRVWGCFWIFWSSLRGYCLCFLPPLWSWSYTCACLSVFLTLFFDVYFGFPPYLLLLRHYILSSFFIIIHHHHHHHHSSVFASPPPPPHVSTKQFQ